MQVLAWILFIALFVFMVYEAIQLVRVIRKRIKDKPKSKSESIEKDADTRKEE